MNANIIVAVIGAVVGTGPVGVGIAVFAWWLRRRFCEGCPFMNDLGWIQRITTRKIRVVPETAHRTLGRESVS